MFFRKISPIITLFCFSISLFLSASDSLHIPCFGTLDLTTCPKNAGSPTMTWEKCFNRGTISVIQVIKASEHDTSRELVNGAILQKGNPLLLAEHTIEIKSTDPLLFEFKSSYFAKTTEGESAVFTPFRKEKGKEDFGACIAATSCEAPERNPSNRTKLKAERTAAYNLEKLTKAQAKAAAAATKLQEEQEKKAQEDAYYSTIRTACEKKEYEAALTTLALCDRSTLKYAATLFTLTESTLTPPLPESFDHLTPLIIELIERRPRIIPTQQASYFLLFLSCHGDRTQKRKYLREAADLQNSVAEVQLLALEVRDHLENSKALKCVHGEPCIHRKGARFLTRHANDDNLKPILATYLLSIFSIQSKCPNVELPSSIAHLYEIAERYLSPADYAFLLTLQPHPLVKQAKHTLSQTIQIEGAAPTIRSVIDLTAVVTTAMKQAQSSLPCAVSTSLNALSTSSHRFASGIYEFFNGLNGLDNESREQITSATGTRKKLLQRVFDRKKETLTRTLVTLVETVKDGKEVRLFMNELEKFEKHFSYLEVRAIIDSHLEHSSLATQRLWRPYHVLPQRHMFPSLSSSSIAGSFSLRCTNFTKEVEAYLTTAPMEEEIFPIIEEMIVSFLKTSTAPTDIQSFLDIFRHSHYFYFYITASFHRLKKSQDTTLKAAAHRFKEDLIKQIKQAKTNNCPSPLIKYLEQTLAEIELFIQTTEATTEKVSTVSLPPATDYSDVTKNPFLNQVTQTITRSTSQQEMVETVFHWIETLPPDQAPYLMYALGTRAHHLLPELQKMVHSSDNFDTSLKQALETGFKTLIK